MKNFKVIFIMNNPCFNYFKNRNPIKFISNIFRNYKRSSDSEGSIKRNQSEPAVAHQKISSDDLSMDKQKSKRSLSVAPEKKGVISSDSRESLKLTWSNSKFGRSSSHISLKEKCSYIDLNIREKLESMPVPDSFNGPEISAKSSYPWQNFNIDGVQVAKFDAVKSVDSVTHEFLSAKKSILKRPEDNNSPRQSPSKEVKFNKTASMLIYPKITSSVMRQSKINLSTANNKGNSPGKRKVDEGFYEDKYHVHPNCHRKKYWKHKNDRKLINEEQGYFWYMNKKQKTY